MPARRGVSRGTTRRTPQRKSVWARTSGQQALGIGTQFSVNLLAGFETDYGANLIGSTVVRIRGLMSSRVTTSVSAVADELRVGVRVSNVNETAALGGPVDNPHEDWMLWEPFYAFAVGEGGGGVHLDRVIDVRSMRKMDEINQQLTLFAESFTAAAHELVWSLSVLLKLP